MDVKEIEITWTDKSISDLKSIYHFLFSKSPTVARNEIEKMYSKVSLLEKGFSKIGQREPLLKNYKKEYRYLVSRNYKIIFSTSGNKIYIHTIFDTRQNPKKLKVK